jgi:hypothetical protein
MGSIINSSRTSAAVAMTLGMLALGDVRPAEAGLIFVTNLTQKFGGPGGCSLQEAIHAANTDANVFGDFVLDCAAGSGNDTIVLPTGALLQMSQVFDDIASPFGPAATLMITSTITIEAHGTVLQWVSTGHARLFTVSSTGRLTIRNAYIKGFHVKGGDGAAGGGGGMGAGGAIYVKGSGELTVEASTFQGNGAIGGNGSHSGGTLSGGGGGLSGNGGSPRNAPVSGGGGGGGSRGNGGNSDGSTGAGGGGTLTSGGPDGQAGTACGGQGGIGVPPVQIPGGSNGGDAPCDGGGGGGGESRGDFLASFAAGSGGDGGYGGGGGGSGWNGNGGDDGGGGGFGGGGGAGQASQSNLSGFGPNGGDGGFGGGGGAGHGGFISGGPGSGGTFGGDASQSNGGGGAGLGGAIFSHGGIVVIRNSTFTANFVVRGVAGGAGAQNGGDAGGAIFAVDGSLEIKNSTISANESTGAGGGVVMYRSSEPGSATLTLWNTIIANNGALECFTLGSVTGLGDRNVVMQSPDDGDSEGICPGADISVDPALGPLQMNAPGNTPTMSIPAGSAAEDNADAALSLPTDQRGVDRPQTGAFDIGAYERCPGPVDAFACVTLVIKPPPDTWQLIMSSPSVGGTTDPAPNTYNEPVDTVVVITAIPDPGYYFASWTGTVADATAGVTTVTMDDAQNVAANFAPWPANLQGTGMPGANARSRGPTFAQPRVDLTWSAAPRTVSGYNVLRATTSGGSYASVAFTTTTAFSDQTEGLVVRGTFYYVLHALDSAGNIVGKSLETAVVIPARR